MTPIYTCPTHFIAVDCAIFGYQDGELKLLLYPRSIEPFIGEWSLVNGFLQEDETILESVERILYSRIGIDNVFLNEVHSFSEVKRDPAARVVSLLYYALVRVDELNPGKLDENGAKWWPITDLPSLILDYKAMVKVAFEQLQKDANDQLLGKELLPPFFTLLQLRRVYDCIFQRQFEPANFRKKIMSFGVLKKQVFKNKTESKKGAYYYTFDPEAEHRSLDRIVTLK